MVWAEPGFTPGRAGSGRRGGSPSITVRWTGDGPGTEFSGAPRPRGRGPAGDPAVDLVTGRPVLLGGLGAAPGVGRAISVEPEAAAESIIRMMPAKSIVCGSRTTVSLGRDGTAVSGAPSPEVRTTRAGPGLGCAPLAAGSACL
jgi:hypothetical protein